MVSMVFSIDALLLVIGTLLVTAAICIHTMWQDFSRTEQFGFVIVAAIIIACAVAAKHALG